MKPTVGRIVSYTSLGDRDGLYPPEVQAALITKVASREQLPAQVTERHESFYVVSLHVFYATGQFDMKDVPFTAEPAGTEADRGAWSWPVRES
jgi:hypothetical protein